MGENLTEALANKPKYNQDIIKKSVSERISALSDIYSVYIPNQMSTEIYSKLYFALLHSIEKKKTKEIVMQMHENKKSVLGISQEGIIGGADSFSILGVSGIGKSVAISRAIKIISRNKNICMKHGAVIPFLLVQCPFDASVKGLLLDILLNVDNSIGSHYYENAVKSRATIDMLIGSVSQVAINHIGVLIVDEIQNVVNSRLGEKLIGMLTQLINCSGISICMVGTPDAYSFFEKKIYLARRSIGLKYSAMDYDDAFTNLCVELFKYQYTKYPSEINPSIINWLYEHSQGITAVVVSLIHDAQEIAILSGSEKLDIEALSKAYNDRHDMVKMYVHPKTIKSNSYIPKEKAVKVKEMVSDNLIFESVSFAKSMGIDIVKVLKEKISIEEISL